MKATHGELPKQISLAGSAVVSPFVRARTPRLARRPSAIGVPRVPYHSPRFRKWMWVDLWNCMYRDRIVFLYKPLDDQLANQLVATLLSLDGENQKDIFLYINCSGGDVSSALDLHDTMRYIQSDVGAVAFGGAYGMAGFLLAVAKKASRLPIGCIPSRYLYLLDNLP